MEELRVLAPGEVGAIGETLAARHLRRHGYRVLYRNFRPTRGGEIDIICRDVALGELVFVEVKTRTSEVLGRPADAVDREKQRRLAKGAMAWLRLLDHPPIRFRFDVVEVVLGCNRPKIEVLRDAFTLPEPMRY